jgi:hypothetical protein
VKTVADEIVKLRAERDEARRMFCRVVASEFTMRTDVLRLAADHWGREAALALWADDVLRAYLGECSDEYVEEDFAEAHASLDAKHPASKEARAGAQP